MAQRIPDQERILPRIRQTLRTPMPQRMRTTIGKPRPRLKTAEEDRESGRRETLEAAVCPAPLRRKNKITLGAVVGKKLLKRLEFIRAKRMHIRTRAVRVLQPVLLAAKNNHALASRCEPNVTPQAH